MNLKETTAAVTGATGAVGSVVARRLSREGARVRAIVRRELKLHEKAELPGVEIRRAELTDRAALAEALGGAQLVVHCAAALSRDEAECRRANIDGVRNLVEAAVTAGVALDTLKRWRGTVLTGENPTDVRIRLADAYDAFASGAPA